MNEDRHIILDNDMNTYPNEENNQGVNEVENSFQPMEQSKPKKEFNAAALLIGILIFAVVGTTVSLLVIPIFFTKKVEPAVEDNIALSASCANVDEVGNYENGKIKCQDFVCTLNKDGKKITKECAGGVKKIDPEGSLDEEELNELVDIGG